MVREAASRLWQRGRFPTRQYGESRQPPRARLAVVFPGSSLNANRMHTELDQGHNHRDRGVFSGVLTNIAKKCDF